MDVYDKPVQYLQKYHQWHEINFWDENPIYFSFFQAIKDTYEVVKEKVMWKESISKEYIQEFLVKPSKEFSYIWNLSTSLWLTWRIIKNVILLSISRKNTSSTLERKESSLSTKHGASIFWAKEDNCTILYIKFVNIRFSKLVIFFLFPCK